MPGKNGALGVLGLKNSVLFYSTAFDVIVLDQLTKYLARKNLAMGEHVTLIPGFLDLRLNFNTGGAFGALSDYAPLLVIIAIVVIFAIVKLRSMGSGSTAVSIGLGLLLGGAIGNLIDRIGFPKRGVTDFIDIHFMIKGELHSWPTFNVADVAIVAGAILVLFHVYVIERARTDDEHPEAAD